MSPQTLVVDRAATVRGLYAAFLRGDLQTLLASLAEDVEWIVPGPDEIPFAGVRKGRPQVAEFFRLLGQAVTISPFEPKEYIYQDDRVAVVGSYAGTVKQTGKSFRENWVMVWEFKGGKVSRFCEYMDPASLAAAFRR